MGEAKNRGTFEERKAEAIKRNKKIYQERMKKRAEIEAAKTPEQRRKDREKQIFLAQTYATMAPYLKAAKELKKIY